MSDINWLAMQITLLARKGYTVIADDYYKWIMVQGSTLPRFCSWSDAQGRKVWHTSFLIDIPKTFPMIVPGTGSCHPSYAIHSPLLYCNDRALTDLHECKHSPSWHWLCFEYISWNPQIDNLVTIVNVIETSIAKRALKTIH